jgi:hypothetical protein
MEKSKAILEQILKALCSKPDDVSVIGTTDEMGVLLTVKLHREDMGPVIGKGGATARSIRTILRSVGASEKARVNMKIEEPEGGQRPDPSSTQTDSTQDQPVDDIGEMLKD